MKNLLTSTALAVCLAGPSLAQSADDLAATVDTGIQFLNESGAGLSIGAREVGDDGSLLLRDVVLEPEDEDVRISTDFIRIAPVGDTPGDIEVTTADTILFSSEEDGQPIEITVISSNLVMTTNWVQSLAGSPTVTLAADALNVAGGNEESVLRALDVDIDDLDFAFSFRLLDRSIDSRLSFANITAAYEISDPAMGMQQDISYTYGDYVIAFDAQNIPLDEDGVKPFIDLDGAFRLTFEAGDASADMDMSFEGVPVSFAGTAEGGSGEVSLQDGVVLYTADSGPFEYQIAADPSVMPIPPFDVKMDSSDMRIVLPVRQSEEVQNAEVKIALNELEVSEGLWSMIDPEATIPRDPATLLVDMAADVTILQPLVESLDEDGNSDMTNPFEVAQLQLLNMPQVLLTAAGASIAAEGSMEVDNSLPFPQPNGAFDIELSGLQTLADSIAALGLADPTEVAMVKGMMLGFAQPTDEPDVFTTKIEITPEGVTANGIPLPQ